LDYDNVTKQNAPPPALWVDDRSYIAEIKALVLELRRLNDLLETNKKSSKGQISKIARHFDRFLTVYEKHLAIGSAYLTIGVMSSLLSQLGLGPDVVSQIFAFIKPH
jgi:hypothetical protein